MSENRLSSGNILGTEAPLQYRSAVTITRTLFAKFLKYAADPGWNEIAKRTIMRSALCYEGGRLGHKYWGSQYERKIKK